MKIQFKVLLALVLVFTLLLGGFVVWSKSVLERDFGQLEQREIAMNVDRLDNTYQGEIDALHGNVVDYAVWDAFEEFIQNPTERTFLDENITAEGPYGLNLHMLAVTRGNEIIAGFESETIKIDADPLNADTQAMLLSVLQGYPREQGKSLHETILVKHHGRVLALTFMTISYADGSGSFLGRVFFGRYLDEEIRQTIESKTGNHTKMLVAAELDERIAADPSLATLKEKDFAATFLDDTICEFQKIYLDWQGQPAVLFKVGFERKTMEAGKRTITQTIQAIVIFGIFLLAATFITLRSVALRRLLQLTGEVNDIAKTPTPGHRVQEDASHDEIGSLQHGINGMLANIDAQNLVIEKKNQSMSHMLNHMEQGLLVILSDGTIHPELSRVTAPLFSVPVAGGLHWETLFLTDATLDSDARSQMSTALFSILGESSMNWEFNQGSIPRELNYVRGDKRQTLEFSYTPLTDENDTVESLLVSIRDVSYERELAAQAAEKQAELSMLEKLLQLSPQDMQRFIRESLQGIELGLSLMVRETLTPAEIHHLFRELHTLKGNARTCGFRELSALVHDAENGVQQMREHGANPEQMRATGMRLMLVQTSLKQLDETYQTRFRKFLDSTFSRNLLLLPKADVHRLLAEYSRVSTLTPQAAEKFLEDLQSTLSHARGAHQDWTPMVTDDAPVTSEKLAEFMQKMALSSFSTYKQTLRNIHDGLTSVTQALGKPHPRLDLPTHDLLVRKELIGKLEGISGHLLRNSYDHGIENAPLRESVGKSAIGVIAVDYELRHTGTTDRVCLTFRDDGQGLDIAALRLRGVQRGLCTADTAEADVAAIIFAPGFSSRDDITDISGRGVGLDAVVADIRTMGGEWKLVLADKPNPQGRHAFLLEILLPEDSCLIF